MKVRCKSTHFSNEQVDALGFDYMCLQDYGGITIGKEYIAFSVEITQIDRSRPRTTYIVLMDDNENLQSIPIELFDITDSAASPYWSVRIEKEEVALVPADLDRFYPDDYSEGVPEVVERIRTYLKLMSDG